MNISEYVSLGHPDKIADYISEYILDRLIEQDPQTRYALEVQIKDNYVSLAGEVSTNAENIDYEQWTRDAVAEVGYLPSYAMMWGYQNAPDAELLEIERHISQQSPDIAQGVNTDAWGDQGIMFGMAVNNPITDYMPADYYYAKKLCKGLYSSGLGGLDIKTQVEEDDGRVKKVIVAIPLQNDKNLGKIKEFIMDSLPEQTKAPELIINGTGKYVRHASMGDCGTTGRKLAADFYGGNCNVGGGSPWTKDGTKADLTLNLLAREIALNIVKSQGIEYCKCGIGCCIGKKDIDVTIWDKQGLILSSYTAEKGPRELIKHFELDSPIYAELCREGLFSRIK